MSVEEIKQETASGASSGAAFPWEKHLTSVKIAMAKNNDALAEEILAVLMDVAACTKVEPAVRIDLGARMGHAELRSKGADAARRRFEETIQLARKLGMEDNPAVAYCLDGLGDCYEATWEYTRAESTRKKAYAIAERILGPDHQHSKLLKQRLNKLRNERSAELYGSHQKTAFDTLMERAELSNGSQPASAPQPAAADKTDEGLSLMMYEKFMANAQKEIAQKRWREAEGCLQSAFDKAAGFGKNDPRRFQCAFLAGSVMADAGQIAESRNWYEKALTIAFDGIGHYCEETAKCLDRMGDLYLKQDDIVNAKNHFQQAITAYRASVGLEHAGSTQQKLHDIITRIQEERKWQGWSV
jgi:tetratricopeptide (TPR) repeat protein